MQSPSRAVERSANLNVEPRHATRDRARLAPRPITPSTFDEIVGKRVWSATVLGNLHLQTDTSMTEHVGFEAGKKPPHLVVVALQFTTALAQSRQRCANLLIRTGDRREPIVCKPIDGRTLVAPLARRLEPESGGDLGDEFVHPMYEYP